MSVYFMRGIISSEGNQSISYRGRERQDALISLNCVEAPLFNSYITLQVCCANILHMPTTSYRIHLRRLTIEILRGFVFISNKITTISLGVHLISGSTISLSRRRLMIEILKDCLFQIKLLQYLFVHLISKSILSSLCNYVESILLNYLKIYA